MATKHLIFKVTGKVQGVFFRKSTEEKARELGLKGSAENLDDGSVRVHAQGDSAKLDKLEDWLREGPPQARVDHLYREERSLSDFDGFQIIR